MEKKKQERFFDVTELSMYPDVIASPRLLYVFLLGLKYSLCLSVSLNILIHPLTIFFLVHFTLDIVDCCLKGKQKQKQKAKQQHTYEHMTFIFD